MKNKYTLMHKNIPVAEMDIDSKYGNIYNISILNENHLPLIGKARIRNLIEWFYDRAIPNNRKDLVQILNRNNCKTSVEYLIKNLALSLSDTYWIRPYKMNLTWEQVNLFDKKGHVMNFKDGQNRLFYSTNKDSSLGGTLEKYSEYKDSAWWLIKKDDGRSGYGLQNINESFASFFYKRIGFSEYTDYISVPDKHGICSICKCKYFTDENTELISAYNVIVNSLPGGFNAKIAYDNYLDICAEHGLDQRYIENFMDCMLMTDFLISNVDRHWENFGILRNPDDLRFISFAPVYDSGSSMMYDQPYVNSRPDMLRISANGPMKAQRENLELIKNKKIIDLNRTPSKEEVLQFYENHSVPEELALHIAECYCLKKDMLLEFQQGFTISVRKEKEYAHKNGTPFINEKPNPHYFESIQKEADIDSKEESKICIDDDDIEL